MLLFDKTRSFIYIYIYFIKFLKTIFILQNKGKQHIFIIIQFVFGNSFCFYCKNMIYFHQILTVKKYFILNICSFFQYLQEIIRKYFKV